MRKILLLLNGSTRILSLSFNDSSISFFLTHWIPKLANVAVIFSLLISKVQTPLLQISFPTNLCGCALNDELKKNTITFWIYEFENWNLPMRWIFRDTRYNNNSSSMIVYNLYTWIRFIIWRTVCTWYWTSRSPFTLITESKSFWCWLLHDPHMSIRIWTGWSALATLATPRIHCRWIHAIRLCIT